MIPYLENGRGWQRIMHIYQMPFYSIDYVLAQICAFQFWQKSNKKRTETWTDYVNLCNAGGTQPFLKLLELANLNSPFEDGIVKNIDTDILAYLDGIDDKKF
jgi:oligoendopeptidase F